MAELTSAGPGASTEAVLSADRRRSGRQQLPYFDDLPVTASSQRELLATLAEEFYAPAAEIDHGAVPEASHA